MTQELNYALLRKNSSLADRAGLETSNSGFQVCCPNHTATRPPIAMKSFVSDQKKFSVLRYDTVTGFLILNEKEFAITKRAWPFLTEKNINSVMARVELPESEIFKLDEVIGYVPCNVKWSNAMRFDPSEGDGKCLHFILVTEGTAYVIFSAVPNDRNAWYYVQISSHGVGIYKVC